MSGKIQKKIDEAFDRLEDTGDFEHFVLRIAGITDDSVRYNWQYPYLITAIKNRLNQVELKEVLSDELLSKRVAEEL